MDNSCFGGRPPILVCGSMPNTQEDTLCHLCRVFRRTACTSTHHNRVALGSATDPLRCCMQGPVMRRVVLSCAPVHRSVSDEISCEAAADSLAEQVLSHAAVQHRSPTLASLSLGRKDPLCRLAVECALSQNTCEAQYVDIPGQVDEMTGNNA